MSIEVPISLPTDSASVKAAAAVVKGLQGAVAGLGPAAAASARQAEDAFNRVTTAASRARDATGRFLPKGAANAPGVPGIPGVGGRDAKGRFLPGAGKDPGLLAAQAAQKVEKAQAAADKKALAAAQKQAEAIRKGKEAASFGRIFDEMAASGAAAFGKLSVAAYAFAAAASAAFVVALIKVQAFKEGAQGALTRLLGSAGAAQSAINKAVAASSKIGVGVKEAVQGVNQLVAKGFGADQALDLVKAMADLKSVVPDANIGNLLLAITQVKSKGVLQMEELQGQIAEAGLSVSVVLEEIGKKIGKSAADVRKMISQGKISADQGIAGIMAAIQKTTGKPLGKAAEEAAKSLGGLISRVEDLPTALLFAADASKGMGVVKSVLKNVLDAFAPGTKTGDMFAAALGRLGDAFARLIEPLSGGEGASTFARFAEGAAGALDQISKVVSNIGDLFGPMIKGLLDGLGAGLKVGAALDGVSKNEAGLKAAGEALGKIGKALGFIAGLAFEGVLGAIDKVASVQAAWGSLDTFLTSLPARIIGAIVTAAQTVYQGAISIGSNLVQGIIAGITGGLPGLLGVIASLANVTTGAAKGGYQVASPSKLWEDDIGYQLKAGEAKGIEKGQPLVNRALARTGAGSMGAARGSKPSAAGPGSGPSIVIEAGAFVFNGMMRGDVDLYEERTRAFLAEMAAA